MQNFATASPRPSGCAALVTVVTIVAAVAAVAAPGAAVAASAAKAQPPVQWRSVAQTDTQQAYVDPASRRDRDGYVEAVVRYEYAQPQPYGRRTFQSARNVYRFDCAGGRIADRENVVYAEPELQGRKVGDATRSTKNLVWRAVAPRSIDGVVLDHVCRKMGGGTAMPASPPTTSGSAQPPAPAAGSSSQPGPASPPPTGVPPPFKP
jgi:hypothetical protein